MFFSRRVDLEIGSASGIRYKFLYPFLCFLFRCAPLFVLVSVMHFCAECVVMVCLIYVMLFDALGSI